MTHQSVVTCGAAAAAAATAAVDAKLGLASLFISDGFDSNSTCQYLNVAKCAADHR